MTVYTDNSGGSGVAAYETGPDWICVTFKYGESYLYTYDSAGSSEVERMKDLALEGEGLSTFISQNRDVYDGWESKGCS